MQWNGATDCQVLRNFRIGAALTAAVYYDSCKFSFAARAGEGGRDLLEIHKPGEAGPDRGVQAEDVPEQGLLPRQRWRPRTTLTEPSEEFDEQGRLRAGGQRLSGAGRVHPAVRVAFREEAGLETTVCMLAAAPGCLASATSSEERRWEWDVLERDQTQKPSHGRGAGCSCLTTMQASITAGSRKGGRTCAQRSSSP